MMMKGLILTSFVGLLFFTQLLGAKTLSPIADADCQNDYLTLMSKAEINVTIAYGYFDISQHKTWDNEVKNYFINAMTAPCKTWDLKTCGFKKTGDAPTVLTRKMTGPDGLIKTVRIKVDSPSLSADNKMNSSNPQQKIRSEEVKQMYLSGLKNSEITIYLGHSRSGGGPDFDPPKLKKDGSTDYSYYHKNTEDKDEILRILAESPNKPRILGFLSCSSISWFSKGVSQSAPGSGFIGTDGDYTVETFKQVLPFLEKIFSYQCIDKLMVPDENDEAFAKSHMKWRVPLSDTRISKADLIKKTLENLAEQLKSPDPDVRREAYREINSFNSALYSQKVWDALTSYQSPGFFYQNAVPLK